MLEAKGAQIPERKDGEEWYVPYIDALGTIGYDTAEKPISREAMAQLVALEYDYPADNAIPALLDAGILTGDDDGAFRPGDTLTRAEASAVIYRLINK